MLPLHHTGDQFRARIRTWAVSFTDYWVAEPNLRSNLERVKNFEISTYSLATNRSASELYPQLSKCHRFIERAPPTLRQCGHVTFLCSTPDKLAAILSLCSFVFFGGCFCFTPNAGLSSLVRTDIIFLCSSVTANFLLSDICLFCVSENL
jgi:hypothetical protein